MELQYIFISQSTEVNIDIYQQCMIIKCVGFAGTIAMRLQKRFDVIVGIESGLYELADGTTCPRCRSASLAIWKCRGPAVIASRPR